MPLNLNDPTTWETSVLLTPEGPIKYWVLADWDAYYEQYEDVNNLTRVLIAVSWFDADTFKTYALGLTERVGAALYFQRYTPLANPFQTAQYLTSLKKSRVHAGVNKTGGTAVYHLPDGLNDNWPTFVEVDGIPPRLVYDATFTCPSFDIVSTSTFDRLPTPEKRELRRYVTRTRQIVPRERKVPSYGFETYDPLNPATTSGALVVPIPEVGFVPDHYFDLYYTWRKVPRDSVPESALAKCLNKINNAVFDYKADGTWGKYQIGTLLFKGLANRIEPYRGPNAEWLVDLPYVFGFYPAFVAGAQIDNSWNYLPRNDGTYSPIRVRGTNPPQPLYQSADLETLFQPGP